LSEHVKQSRKHVRETSIFHNKGNIQKHSFTLSALDEHYLSHNN